jgi:hypothetical protein
MCRYGRYTADGWRLAPRRPSGRSFACPAQRCCRAASGARAASGPALRVGWTQDVLNPEAGQVVPTSFRSDGEWIWTDTVTYYLEEHGLAADEELAAHIEARGQAGNTSAEIDSQTAVDAANFLLYPPPEYARKAAWTPGASG